MCGEGPHLGCCDVSECQTLKNEGRLHAAKGPVGGGWHHTPTLCDSRPAKERAEGRERAFSVKSGHQLGSGGAQLLSTTCELPLSPVYFLSTDCLQEVWHSRGTLGC